VKIWNRTRWPRSLTIEVEEADFLQGKRDPLLPVKNQLYKTVRRKKIVGRQVKTVPIKIVTPRHAHFRKVIRAVSSGLEASAFPYKLTIEQMTRRRRKVAEAFFPGVDNDACLAGVKDALERAGLLLDDAQIVSDHVYSVIGDRWQLRITLEADPGWFERNGVSPG